MSENPKLNILGTKEIINLNKDKINSNFKFFLTFNPSNLGKRSINQIQILFISCARFSLTFLDTFNSDSTSVIYNSRYENKITQKLWGKYALNFLHAIKLMLKKVKFI